MDWVIDYLKLFKMYKQFNSLDSCSVKSNVLNSSLISGFHPLGMDILYEINLNESMATAQTMGNFMLILFPH